MINPATGERECNRTTATPEEVQQHIDEVFSLAGYHDFEIKKEKATTLSTGSSTQWLEQLEGYDFDPL